LVSFLNLLTLAAIWGASFLFMRIAAPALGALWVAELRVALAAVFLAILCLFLRKRTGILHHWRYYLQLGLFNSALPFLLFAYAAQALSASLLAILNATAPFWGAIIGGITGRQPLTSRAGIGLVLGVVGVAVLVGLDSSVYRAETLPAVLATLTATLCYGVASHHATTVPALDPFANAQGSMWASLVLLLPAALFFPAPAVIPAPEVIAAIAALGILCSGVAYILYFRLVNDLGPTPALSVTFLIPVFGVLWGWAFLDEAVGWHTLIGGCVVVLGTMLVSGLTLSQVRSAANR
jgi:drug/metabolite transporter (DMT)-like permease